MNREEVAKAYRNLGVAFLQAAEVLEGATIQEPPAEHPEELHPLPALRQSPPTVQGVEQSAPDCPVHGVAMIPSKRPGMDWYCSRPGADPAWTNPKGYCTLNSQNMGTYRGIVSHAAY